MANGVINLVLKSISSGSGYDDVVKNNNKIIAQQHDMGKASVALGKAFGQAGQLYGAAIKTFLAGGVWELAAQGVSKLIGLWQDYKQSLREAVDADLTAMDKRLAAIDKYEKAAKRAADASTNNKRAIDAYERECQAIARTIKANNELERQRRIANGEDAESVNDDINSRNALEDRFAKVRGARGELKKAEEDLNAAQSASQNADAALRDAMRARAVAMSKMSQRAQDVFYENNRFAVRNGLLSLSASDESTYMRGRNDEEYEKRRAKVAEIEEKIKELQAAQAQKAADLNNATSSRIAALERVRAAETENHAAVLKEANERNAAERTAEDERLAAVLKNLEDARAAKEKALQDAYDREVEFQHMLREQEEKEALDAERKANKKKLDDIKAEHRAKMEALDKEIAKAKEEAAVWDRNAQRARDFARQNGGGFAAWNAQQRDEARAKERGDRKQANAVRNAEAEYQRLFNESMKRGRHMNPARRKRMEDLEQFLNEQKGNNPAERKARELEQKRKQAEEKMQKDVGEILTWLKVNGGL